MSASERTRGAPAGRAHECVDGRCVTCGDVADCHTVAAVDTAAALADCVDDDGARRMVDVALVDPVAAGDVVLVHAGVALAKLDRPLEPRR